MQQRLRGFDHGASVFFQDVGHAPGNEPAETGQARASFQASHSPNGFAHHEPTGQLPNCLLVTTPDCVPGTPEKQLLYFNLTQQVVLSKKNVTIQPIPPSLLRLKLPCCSNAHITGACFASDLPAPCRRTKFGCADRLYEIAPMGPSGFDHD